MSLFVRRLLLGTQRSHKETIRSRATSGCSSKSVCYLRAYSPPINNSKKQLKIRRSPSRTRRDGNTYIRPSVGLRFQAGRKALTTHRSSHIWIISRKIEPIHMETGAHLTPKCHRPQAWLTTLSTILLTQRRIDTQATTRFWTVRWALRMSAIVYRMLLRRAVLGRRSVGQTAQRRPCIDRVNPPATSMSLTTWNKLRRRFQGIRIRTTLVS